MNATEYLNGHWIKKKIWRHLASPIHQRRFDMIASFLPEGGKTFADVGCGCGHSTRELANRKRRGRWTGIDFGTKAIAAAKRRFPELLFEYAETIEGLGESIGRFDGIVCSEVIEHVEDDATFVASLLNMTRETLVVTTPARKVADPGHIRQYSAEQLAELFSAAPHEIQREGPFFYVICRNPR